ncbi:hypothetical protein [Cupriavidus sp. DF5525]|uniref:hypothetical protein n=1 Tax=Cupriavidus sp. DF5525 TaxID=3160989 RepID=UPI0032DED9AD
MSSTAAIELLKDNAVKVNDVALVNAACKVEDRTCLALSCVEAAEDLVTIGEMKPATALRAQNLLKAAACLLRMNIGGEDTAFATGNDFHKP